jgi:hypothetical protein
MNPNNLKPDIGMKGIVWEGENPRPVQKDDYIPSDLWDGIQANQARRVTDPLGYVDEYFHTLFGDRTSEYLDVLADMIEGPINGTMGGMIVFQGGLGKSTLMAILNQILEEEAVHVPSSVLSNYGGHSGADIHFANLFDKKFIWMEEEEPDFKINASVLKSLTGNDQVITRKHYQSPVLHNNVPKNIVVATNENDQRKYQQHKARIIQFEKFQSNPDFVPPSPQDVRDYLMSRVWRIDDPDTDDELAEMLDELEEDDFVFKVSI